MKSDLSTTGVQAAVPSPARPVAVAYSGTALANAIPSLLAYLAPDGSGNLQAYTMPLGNGATLQGTQTGSIPATAFATTTVCGVNAGAQNYLQQATTGFGILEYIPAANASCPTSGVVNSSVQTLWVNYGDNSSTAAQTVPVQESDFGPLYTAQGQLYGLVGLDPGTHTLNLYAVPQNSTWSQHVATQLFNSPTALLPDAQIPNVSVQSVVNHDEIQVNRSGTAIASVSFFHVIPASGSDIVVRVDTANTVWAYQPPNGVTVDTGGNTLSGKVYDNANFYFLEKSTSQLGVLTCSVWAYSLTSAQAPSEIYAWTPGQAALCTLEGADGTYVFVDSTQGSAHTLLGIAVTGGMNQTPKQFLSVTTANSFPVLEVGVDYATDDLFVSWIDSGTLAWTNSVYRPSGGTGALVGPVVNAFYQPIGNSTLLSGSWVAVTNLPANQSTPSASQAELQLASVANPATLGSVAVCPLCGGGPYMAPGGASILLMAPAAPALGVGFVLFSGQATPNQLLLMSTQSATPQIAQYAVSGTYLIPIL